jgi:hypothetical protein
MQRYLNLGVAGEVRHNLKIRKIGKDQGWTNELLKTVSDLPRHGEAKVALLLFDRRADPSFRRGFLP